MCAAGRVREPPWSLSLQTARAERGAVPLSCTGSEGRELFYLGK